MRKLVNFLDKMRRRTRECLGVSWEEDRVVLTLVSQGVAGPVVEKTAVFPMSSGEGTEQVRAFSDFCAAERLSGHAAVLALPQPWAVARTLRVPSTDPEEIQNMVTLQACRQMPFSAEEITVEKRCSPKTAGDGYPPTPGFVPRFTMRSRRRFRITSHLCSIDRGEVTIAP